MFPPLEFEWVLCRALTKRTEWLQLLLLLPGRAALGLRNEASSKPLEKECPGENDPAYSQHQLPGACV